MEMLNKELNYNTEPWGIPFWSRLKKIIDTKKKKVVYIYEQADTSTFRYRVYNTYQALSYSDSWSASFFFQDELSLLKKYLDNVDVVIFCRTRWSFEIGDFFNEVKRKSIHTLFDIDDLVFDIESVPLVMNTLNVDFDHPESYSHWFSYSSRLWLMGKMCDGVIGTNKFLEERLAKVFDKPTFVINNFLNNEQIRISNELYAKKKTRKGKFKIGYFSGSPSHINDFKKIAGEIGAVLEKYPDIILEVVGFMEFPESLKIYEERGQIMHSPLVDFLTLQKKISEADVNIITLVENEFTNCKSELKFFEAAIVGTVTCAVPTYVYKENIKDGHNGFLCKDGDWFSVLEKIYKNKIDPQITERARNYCLDKYSPKNQKQNIEKMLDGLMEMRLK